jgi:hypothetical protein
MRPGINIASFGTSWADSASGILSTLKDYASEAVEGAAGAATTGATESLTGSLSSIAEKAAAAHGKALGEQAQPAVTQASSTMKIVGIAAAVGVAGLLAYLFLVKGRK